jgi:hypothetical protein
MGRILDLLKSAGGSAPLSGALGRWRQAVSATADTYLSTSGFLTQADWAVDSVNGSDSNPGTPDAPFKTLSALAFAWTGRTFDPSLSAVNVSLLGSFTNQVLVLLGIFPGPIALNVTGQMTVVGSGTITNWQAFVPGAPGTRSAITDAAQDFTPHVHRRIRMTSGAAKGAVTRICSLGSGPTVANVGKFYTSAGLIGTAVDPSNGDSYVIETFNTDIREYHMLSLGGQTTTISDVVIRPGTGVSQSDTSATSNIGARLFGCDFDSTGALEIIATADQTWIACASVGSGAFQTTECFMSMKGFCAFNTLWHALGSHIQASNTVHDGGGSVNASLRVTDQSQVADIVGFRAFFGVVDGTTDALVSIGSGGDVWGSEGSVQTWGSGNTTTFAFRVRNGGQCHYDTKPTVLGGTPGNDVKLGPSVLAWAGIPACNAPPDNAAFNVRIQ